MKAFLDTNVIVDVVSRREPFFEDSQAILALCANGELEGAVSDLTFCNVAYVLRKHLGNDQVRGNLRDIKRILRVVPVGDSAIQSALDNTSVDFEDAVQLAAAVNWGGGTDCDAKHPPFSDVARSCCHTIGIPDDAMKIEEHKIAVREVFDGYVDSAELGVRGYGGKLNIRPAFQREFVYRRIIIRRRRGSVV